MSNPTTRVLALLELLQTHGLMRGAELAARLEVDPRTLRRYIQTLEQLGIPVTAERGRDGGYRLMHGFKLPPMMFTNDEAVALSLGLVASRNLGLSDAAPAGEGALAKLQRVMPDNLRRRVQAIGETVTLGIARATSSGDPDILATLGAGAQKRQRVRIQYQTPNQTKTLRSIDPYGLAYLNGGWYTVGYCHLRKDLRSFRLDRILSADLEPQSFGRPENFDPIAFLKTAIATLPRAHSVTVLLHADLAASKDESLASLGILEPTTDGTLLHAQVEDLHWMARELARLSVPFEIRHPIELNGILADHARTLMKLAKK
jgi:predicted DNA-binding transcriptional regulator YafY